MSKPMHEKPPSPGGVGGEHCRGKGDALFLHDWMNASRGDIRDLAAAVRKGWLRPENLSAEQRQHLVDILVAAVEDSPSTGTGRRRKIAAFKALLVMGKPE